MYDISQSYFWDTYHKTAVLVDSAEEMPSPVLSLTSSTSFKRSREWEDYYLREREWPANDEISLHAGSNDSEHGPLFDCIREQYVSPPLR